MHAEVTFASIAQLYAKPNTETEMVGSDPRLKGSCNQNWKDIPVLHLYGAPTVE